MIYALYITSMMTFFKLWFVFFLLFQLIISLDVSVLADYSSWIVESSHVKRSKLLVTEGKSFPVFHSYSIS